MPSIPLIDLRKERDELLRLIPLHGKLRSELFESCCQLQRDPTSVEFSRLSELVFDLRVIEKRRNYLERLLTPPLLDPRD
jgi:hypothetical protein